MTLLTTPPAAGTPPATPAPAATPSSGVTPPAAGEQTATGEAPPVQKTDGQEPAKADGSDTQPKEPPKAEPKGTLAPLDVKPTKDGYTLAEQPKKALLDVAKSLNLSQDAVQQVVEAMVPALQAQGRDSITKMVQGWHDETVADPEIGGDKLPETKSLAQRALAFAPPGLVKLLGPVSEGGTGLGNHRDVLAWAAAIGRKLSPDTKVVTGTPGQAPPKSALERLAAGYETNKG